MLAQISRQRRLQKQMALKKVMWLEGVGGVFVILEIGEEGGKGKERGGGRKKS